jgi:hypothetical protein
MAVGVLMAWDWHNQLDLNSWSHPCPSKTYIRAGSCSHVSDSVVSAITDDNNIRGAAFLVKTGVADMLERGRECERTTSGVTLIEAVRAKKEKALLVTIGDMS